MGDGVNDESTIDSLCKRISKLEAEVKYLRWTVQYVVLPILIVILGKLISGL